MTAAAWPEPRVVRSYRDGSSGEHLQECSDGHVTALLPDEDLSNATDAKRAALHSRLLDSAAMDLLPAPVPLVAGHLYRDSIAELWGKPGCGKSFVGVDWALCVATGKPWQAHQVQQGRVLYVVAEGLAGIGKRRRAWERAWHRTDDGAMTWLQGAVPLMDVGWVDALAEVVAEMRPVLIVIDTLSRSIAGHNENAPETMSKVVENADRIRTAAGGACVLFIHHATKDGSTNRGHSALEGACDVRWKLTKDDTGLVLSNPKAKDDQEAPDAPLRLLRIDLPGEADELGQPLTSCVVESHGRSVSPEDPTSSEAHLLTVMRDSFGTTGCSGKALRDTAGLPNSTHYRALNSLHSRGSVINTGTQQRPFYVLPPEAAQ